MGKNIHKVMLFALILHKYCVKINIALISLLVLRQRGQPSQLACGLKLQLSRVDFGMHLTHSVICERQ